MSERIDMPFSTTVAPYDVVFAVMLAGIALIRGDKLAAIARVLILLYIPSAFIFSIYILGFKREIWRAANNELLSDDERYTRATRRSSAVYVILNILFLVGAKILGVPSSNLTYNYLSLFGTKIITYIYDRSISTDDGLVHFHETPARTIFNAYLSICSPSFMRYLIVLACEIPLALVIAHFIGSLIPEQCWLARTLFKKSIVPVFVFSIVAGPLRFAWAYPTVSEAGRVPYLTAYIIAFFLLAAITYASGTIDMTSIGGVLVLVGIIAVLLQFGNLSDASHEPDVYDDAAVMPTWAMTIAATVVLIASLIISYRFFKAHVHSFLLETEGTGVPTRGKTACRQRTTSIVTTKNCV